MAAKTLVALVEDDLDQAALYSLWLRQAGFESSHFQTIESFRRHLRTASVDAALIDWMLPDGSGVELVEWLRSGANAKLPIIVLTARQAEADIVRGLQAGADDYLVKPLREGEFIARLHSVLRRSGFVADGAAIDNVAPYRFDLGKRKVSVAGTAVELTDREFDLAVFLFRRSGHVVSRETLLDQVWNISQAVNTRTIDTHVSRLRKKLQLDASHGWRLSSIYQHGYRLEQA